MYFDHLSEFEEQKNEFQQLLSTKEEKENEFKELWNGFKFENDGSVDEEKFDRMQRRAISKILLEADEKGIIGYITPKCFDERIIEKVKLIIPSVEENMETKMGEKLFVKESDENFPKLILKGSVYRYIACANKEPKKSKYDKVGEKGMCSNFKAAFERHGKREVLNHLKEFKKWKFNIPTDGDDFSTKGPSGILTEMEDQLLDRIVQKGGYKGEEKDNYRKFVKMRMNGSVEEVSKTRRSKQILLMYLNDNNEVLHSLKIKCVVDYKRNNPNQKNRVTTTGGDGRFGSKKSEGRYTKIPNEATKVKYAELNEVTKDYCQRKRWKKIIEDYSTTIPPTDRVKAKYGLTVEMEDEEGNEMEDEEGNE